MPAPTLHERIATLARDLGTDVGEPAIEQLARYGTCLAEDPLAPTTVRDPSGIAEDHLSDSLAALALAPVTEATSIVDIGSGAGLPGIPLAIALPEARVTLVESNRRKAAFLARAVAACRADNVEIAAVRAEAWPAGAGRHDLVTARALDHLSVVAEYAAPLLVVGGWLVAWRGRRQPEVEIEAARAADLLGMEIGDIVRVAPYAGAEHRHLHLMRKVAETPGRFPRRVGISHKRPLGVVRGRSDRRER